MMPIKHEFVSTKEDGADTSLVRPSDWNAVHVGTSEPDKVATVAASGADYTNVFDAISGVHPVSDTNRALIKVYGKVTETMCLHAYSYIDVVGFNAVIEQQGTNVYGVDFDHPDTIWRNITLINKGTQNQGAPACVITDDADETTVLANCKFICEHGANVTAQTGISIRHGTSPKLYNCTGIGGNNAAGYGHGILITDSATPQLFNCMGICRNAYGKSWNIISSAKPTMIGCVGLASDVNGRALYIGDGASPIVDGFVGRPKNYSYVWDYDDANDGRFRPFASEPYQLISISILVNTANTGVTLDLGTTASGTQIAEDVDIGTIGIKSFDFTRSQLTADAYMYATPSAGINDGDIEISYVVCKNDYYAGQGIYLETKGFARIDNSSFYSNGASPTGYIKETTVKNWWMNGCHVETYDPTGQVAFTAESEMTDVPITRTLLVGGTSNITLREE